MTLFSHQARVHHFITRSELVADRRFRGRPAKKAWEHEVEEGSVIGSPTRRSVDRVASLKDLFSLIPGTSLNLERLFHPVEVEAAAATWRILSAVDAATRIDPADVRAVLHLRHLNFVRNPNNIERTLNQARTARDLRFTDRVAADAMNSLDEVADDQLRFRADRFDVSVDQYRDWLRTLAVLCVPFPDGRIPLVEIVNEFMFDGPHATLLRLLVAPDGDERSTFVVPDRGMLFEAVKSQQDSAFQIATLSARVMIIGVTEPNAKEFRLAAQYGPQAVDFIRAGLSEVSVESVDQASVRHYNKLLIGYARAHVYSEYRSPVGTEGP